jgi:hypothetical protein
MLLSIEAGVLWLSLLLVAAVKLVQPTEYLLLAPLVFMFAALPLLGLIGLYLLVGSWQAGRWLRPPMLRSVAVLAGLAVWIWLVW